MTPPVGKRHRSFSDDNNGSQLSKKQKNRQEVKVEQEEDIAESINPETPGFVKLEPVEERTVLSSQGQYSFGDLAPIEAVEYEKNILSISTATFREASVRGFVLRSFDVKIFLSISACSLFNLLHQSKTNSPIVVVRNFDDFSRIVIIDGSHRICQLLSRAEDASSENFVFETIAYAACKDFDTVFDGCVEIRETQTERANVPLFPPAMINLVQTTYGREFAKSLAQYSKKEQAEALSTILDVHIQENVKEDIRMALSHNNAAPLLALYRECFKQGLVASESSESHSEKSPYFQYFMGPETGKLFLKHINQVYAGSKCHLLILKSSSSCDRETAEAVQNYLDKKTNGKQLIQELNRIIKGGAYISDASLTPTAPLPTSSLTTSSLTTELKEKKTSKRSKSPMVASSGKGPRGVAVDDFQIVQVKTLCSLPDCSIVIFQKSVSDAQMETALSKRLSLVVQNVSTSLGLLVKLASLGGEMRLGVCGGSTILGAGEAFVEGDEIRCVNVKMFLLRSAPSDQAAGRKDNRTVFEFVA
ncbi:hypothetical protein CAEBREN_12944 [Caenorhabditis brenneri]|uniref:Uncharacterized protein n=1 Tax=Caenorhabditis brenneri TaxID=135651 RepID=G0P1H6_CAEBE|nr:hypothetical protein CAEBREN_12944 [Caenorhabditis brenneri]